MNWNLALPLYARALSSPDRTALRVDGVAYTYGDAARRAQAIRDWLWQRVPAGPRRVAILGGRTAESYLGLLGACWSGAGYVPISPKLPASRLRQVFEIVQPDAVLVDAEGELALAGFDPCPAVSPANLSGGSTFREPDQAAADSLAYIIFTSGSTGVPKGVVVQLQSVHCYLDMMRARYGLGPDDCVAQPCELGFDVSVSNIFMAWQAGATLTVVPSSQAMAPRDFIRAEAPTFWFSTPAPAVFLEQMKMLRPGVFPSIRYSCFAGDVLPLSMVDLWAAAAPNSVVENLYGPTEATVVCAGTRYTGADVVTQSRGIVSIGTALPGSELMVADESGTEVAPGTSGELLIGGPQLAQGYWNDEALTVRRFPTLAGKRWYRSGDLVYQDPRGLYHHLGRLDDQVKIRGFRVELGEIEAHMRDVCASNSVVAVPWPVRLGSATGIVAFVSGTRRSPAEVQQALKDRLPSHLVPNQVRTVDELPIGLTGKFDRKALAAMLQKEA